MPHATGGRSFSGVLVDAIQATVGTRAGVRAESESRNIAFGLRNGRRNRIERDSEREIERTANMSKLMVSRIFWASLAAMLAGLVVLAIATGVGFATTGLTWRGPDIVGIQPTPITWVAGSVGVVAILAFLVGVLGGFVAWIGALLNTAQLEDKVWFLVLLLLGIFGLGFIPMLVYVLAGPEGTATVVRAPEPPIELPKAA